MIAEAENMENLNNVGQNGPSEMEEFKMDRKICTVEKAWEEYSLKLKNLEASYGYKWRKAPTEKMFFLRRRPLFLEIERRIEAGEPVDVILKDLEETRGKKSLFVLCKMLKQ